VIRIAVIGLGKMGLLHASLLNTIPGVSVVALCEKSGLVRRFTHNVFPGVAVVEAVNDLSAFSLDAAYVTTPPSSHCAVVNTLLTRGICHNVFVEKPLANNSADSGALADLWVRLGKDGVNMVGYNRRFGVTFKKAKTMITEGVLGQLASFGGHAFSSAFHSVGNRRGNSGRDGVIKDLGCHAIDLALWYIGDVRIESIVSSRISPGGGIDSADIRVRTKDGVEGSIKTSWLESGYRLPEIGFVAEGTNGLTLTVNDDKLELRTKNGERRVWYRQEIGDSVGFLLGGADYWREDKAFIDATTTGTAVEQDFEAASRVDKIIQQAEMRIIGQS
jgi:predicted dehydrogenase